LVVFLVGAKRDPVGYGAALRWHPGGRLLGPWRLAVHGEEEMMVQLVKRVKMPTSAAAPMDIIVLVGCNGGGVSRSIDSQGNHKSEGGHH
jgi:hypothetical protein